MSVDRRWSDPLHVDAGYHEQEWGPVPTPDHELIGTYEGAGGVIIHVRHVVKGVTGNPEFEIEWQGGHRVTVVDDSTALRYLIEYGAVEVVG